MEKDARRLLRVSHAVPHMRNDSSKFYDSFADEYDTMVSDERCGKDLPFFKSTFEKNHLGSALDCSCGTDSGI
jgi:hypothetical protein